MADRIVARLISGGQTGADRGGLEAARMLDIPTGGWAPSGYWTEDGPDPSLAAFGLREGGSLAERTRRNAAEADATVVFACRPSPGSDLTVRCCARLGRPYAIINPFAPDAADRLRAFLRQHRPRTLNVAGHRESRAPGIGRAVRDLLIQVLGERPGPPATPAA
jgi:hypothetical protein